MKFSHTNKTRHTSTAEGITLPGLFLLLIFTLFFIPTQSFANPGKTTTCLDCHTTNDTTASIYVAVDGAEHNTASNYVLSSYTGAAQDVEIDYYFKNATNSANGESISLWINVPSGWAVAPGTVNNPTGTNFGANWSSAWDVATSNGGGAGETYYTVATGDPTYYPNSPDSYSIYWHDHSGSAWDAGNNKGAYDDGTTNDQDGVADTMGTDFKVTVPAGLGAGTTHEIVVMGIGHEGTARSHVSTTLTIEIPSSGDSTPPSSTITDPTDAATLNSASADPYTITGTASDNDTVSLVEVNINGGGWQAATDTGGGDWSTWSFSWTLPADGSYTIQSRATDASSNQEGGGAGNAGITVTVDTTAPSVSSTVPTDTATDVILDSNVTINWDDNVDCATVNTTNITSTSPGWAFSTCSGSQAVFTTSGQSSSTIYNVSVTTAVTDDAGNPMGAQYDFSYTTGDFVEPSSTVTDPTDSAVLTSASADPYTITGTASDNDTVSLVEVSINGGPWQTATGTTSWTYSWILPADGSYTIESRATDTSSNQEGGGAGNAGISVTVDRTAPTFSGVTGATDAASGGAVDLTWNTATEATSPPVTYNIYYATTSGGQNFSTPDATSSNATGDTVTGLTNDQIYYFVVKAEDSVGNESTSPTELSATPTAPASCAYATPSVTILTADKDIAFDGGMVKYTVRVTNNDSIECSPTDFNLTVVDSNSTNFYPSTADISPLNVSPQSFAETTIRVTAKSNQTNGPTNATSFYTEADGNHAQSGNSNSVTTTINVTGVGCLTDGSIVNGNGDQLIMSR